MTIEVRGLAAALFVASPPPATAVEVVGELIAAEVRSRPGLVDVFTPPYVREGVRFDGTQDSYGSERVGRVLEGV